MHLNDIYLELICYIIVKALNREAYAKLDFW